MSYLIFPILLIILNFPAYCQVKVSTLVKKADAYSRYSEDMVDAMRFALEIKDLKKQVLLKNYFHDGSVEDINLKCEQIKKDGADIIIGGETSQFAMVIVKHFKDKVFITPTASSSFLNSVHPFPIRMIHSDEQYADLASYVVRKEGLKRVGVFHNRSYPNTDLIAKKIQQDLAVKKIPIINVSYINGQDITSELLNPFIKGNVDGVMVFSYENDLRKIYSTLKDAGVAPLFVGADGWGRDEFLLANLLSRNSQFRGLRALYWYRDRKEKYFIEMKTKLEKHFRKPVDAFYAIGFDTMKLVLDVLKTNPQVEEFNETVLKNEFTEFLTTRKLSFSKARLPLKDFYLFRLSTGKIEFYGEYSEQR